MKNAMEENISICSERNYIIPDLNVKNTTK